LFLGALLAVKPVAETDLFSFSGDSVHNYLTVRQHRGIVVPHHTSMAYLISNYSDGVEITYGRVRFGGDNWEKYFNYPEIGIGFTYHTFGNREVYGDGFALFPYFNMNIYRSKRLMMQHKIALGIGYATKPFDAKTNYFNMVFGSHFNAYVGFGFLIDYRMFERLSVSTSLSLNHMSNGAMKKPNNGINTATVSMGLRYHFNPLLTPEVKKMKAPESNIREWLIIGNVGRNQGIPFNPNYFWSGSLGGQHIWHVNAKTGFGVGAEMIYYGGAPYVYQVDDSHQAYSFFDFYYSGAFASYNLLMGRTTIFVNVGAYLSYKTKPRQPVYPRLGIRHQLSKNLVASFGIKANFFAAEFLEFGVGYRFLHQHNNNTLR
jgi:hypothetical protein